jgi:hypothetical protein
MVIIVVCALLFLVIVLDIIKTFNQKQVTEKPTLVDDETVTVEDMILHDMNNDNDTFDIGAIDFNE